MPGPCFLESRSLPAPSCQSPGVPARPVHRGGAVLVSRQQLTVCGTEREHVAEMPVTAVMDDTAERAGIQARGGLRLHGADWEGRLADGGHRELRGGG